MNQQNQTEKAAARQVRIYENKMTPAKGYNFSVSIPGIANTMWLDTRKEAEDIIKRHGFSVLVEVPAVRISKAEHAALVAVEEAAKAMIRPAVESRKSIGVKKFAYDVSTHIPTFIGEVESALKNLADLRKGGVQ